MASGLLYFIAGLVSDYHSARMARPAQDERDKTWQDCRLMLSMTRRGAPKPQPRCTTYLPVGQVTTVGRGEG